MEYYKFHAQCYIAFILGTCQWSFECYRGYIVLYCQVFFSWCIPIMSSIWNNSSMFTIIVHSPTSSEPSDSWGWLTPSCCHGTSSELRQLTFSQLPVDNMWIHSSIRQQCYQVLVPCIRYVECTHRKQPTDSTKKEDLQFLPIPVVCGNLQKM